MRSRVAVAALCSLALGSAQRIVDEARVVGVVHESRPLVLDSIGKGCVLTVGTANDVGVEAVFYPGGFAGSSGAKEACKASSLDRYVVIGGTLRSFFCEGSQCQDRTTFVGRSFRVLPGLPGDP